MILFVLRSGDPNANAEKTIESCHGLFNQVFSIGNINKINSLVQKTGDAVFLVLYDNEYLEEDLRSVIPLYVDSKFDVVSLFSKTYDGIENKYHLSPRLFKGNMRIKQDRLYPEVEEFTHTRSLDGWIVRDDTIQS